MLKNLKIITKWYAQKAKFNLDRDQKGEQKNTVLDANQKLATFTEKNHCKGAFITYLEGEL